MQRSFLITVVYLVWYIYILDIIVNQVAECTWKPRLNSLFSFEGQLCTLRRVLSLLDRYFYNMYIVKTFKIVFSFNSKDTSIFQCLHNIRLCYSIKKCFSTLSECACLHLRIEWRPVCDHAIWTRLVTLARFMVTLQLSTIAFTSHERKQVHAKWVAFYFVQSSTDECKYKTVNMVIVFVKKNENTCPKGRALMNMYRVVLQTKRGNNHVSKRHSNNNDSTTTNYVLWLENMLLLLAEEGLGNSDVTKKKEHTNITD